MADYQIVAVVKLLLEGARVTTDAATGLSKLGDSAKGAQGQLSGTEEAIKRVGSILARYFGAAAMVGFGKMAVEEFANAERGINNIEAQLRSLGPAAKVTSGEVRAFIESLSDTYKIVDDLLVPAFNRLLLVTGDGKVAMEALSVAARFARSGIGDLEGNAQALAMVFQGSARAARTFGIDIKEAADGGFSYAKVIELILEKERGLGPIHADTKTALETLTLWWDKAKEAAGEAIVGIVQSFGALYTVVSHPVEFGKKFSENLKIYGDFATAAKASISDVTEAHKAAETEQTNDTKSEALKRLAADKDTERAKDKAREEYEKGADDRRRLAFSMERDRLRAQIGNEKEGTDERLRLELDLLKAERENAIAEAKAKGGDVAAINRSFDDQENEARKKNAEARRQIEEGNEDLILNARLDAAAQGSRQRFDVEMQMLDLRYQRAVDEADREGRDTTAIRLAWEMEYFAKVQDFQIQDRQRKADEAKAAGDAEGEERQAEYERQIAGLKENSDQMWTIKKAMLEDAFRTESQSNADARQQEIDDAERAGQDTTRIRQKWDAKQLTTEHKFAAAEIGLEKAKRLAKQEEYVGAATAVVGILTSVFGQTKELAIAEAIINAYAAAVKAMAQGGIYGWIAAAAILAQGLAYASKIESTNPGGKPSDSGSTSGGGGSPGPGFDDPKADRAAYLGGKRWSADMLDNAEAGFSEGLIQRASELGRGQLAALSRTLMANFTNRVTQTAGTAMAAPASPSIARLAPEDVAGLHDRLDRIAGGVDRLKATVEEAPTGGGDIHIHGMYGGDAGLKQFYREYERIRKLEDRRRLR